MQFDADGGLVHTAALPGIGTGFASSCTPEKNGGIIMAVVFDKISGTDPIFKNPEYIADSLIFNAIESARDEENYNLFTDHKDVIISTPKNGARVWIWTSSSMKNDTAKLVDVCRFLRDCNIPKVEIYVKQEISGNLSDLYAITSLELDYVVKDEFSLAVFTYTGEKINFESKDSIVRIDRENPKHVRMVRDFYQACREEFRWQDKLDRKISEYLSMELYACVKNGRMLANAAIGGETEKYIRIKSIAVLKEERRKGLGYEMCSFAVNKILERNRQPMLYAHVGNAAAMALWKKTGFKLRDKLYLLKIEDNN